MMKIKKVFGLILALLTTITVFLCNAYAASSSHLRVPIGNYNRINRMVNIDATRRQLTLLDLNKRDFTFTMFKPDAKGEIQKEILEEIQEKGFKVVYIGNPRVYTEEEARKHYMEHDEQHKNKPFYNPLVEYLVSGEVVPMILQKIDSVNAVEEFKKLAGKSNGTESGTLRYNRTQLVPHKSGVNLEYNKIHASGSMAEALREISIIFTEEELRNIFDDDIYLLIKNGLSTMEEDILKDRVTVNNLLQSMQALKDRISLSI